MISSSTSSVLFFDCLLLCLLFCFRFGNSQNPPLTNCPNDTYYDPNSTIGRSYGSNLNFLLSTLSSNASTSPNGFCNFTVGSVDSANDPVIYGLFFCRGDLTTEACHECVATVSTDILTSCPNVKKAAIWVEKCMLRYSNESIFSRLDNRPMVAIFAVTNVSDPTLWNQVLGDTLDQIENAAANDNSGKKFAVKEAKFTEFQKLYALGQCTPDLSSLECSTCLTSVIGYVPGCCTNRPGVRIITPSCDIKYDTSPFYSISTTPPPQPTPNLPPPPAALDPAPATKNDNGGISTRTIVAIVVPISIAIVMLIFVIFCIARRSRKTYNAKFETTDASDSVSTAESFKFNFREIKDCVNNFDDSNRIGEGGFGPVYKGTLPDGKDIAVKRLSKASRQGAEEFVNEIALVAKLQHRNLVRLLGYCLEGEENLLVYEFVPNKSLDYFLFGRLAQCNHYI